VKELVSRSLLIVEFSDENSVWLCCCFDEEVVPVRILFKTLLGITEIPLTIGILASKTTPERNSNRAGIPQTTS
jgi:hypothetical protein